MTSCKSCCKQFENSNQSFSDVLKFVEHLCQETVVVWFAVLFSSCFIRQTAYVARAVSVRLWLVAKLRSCTCRNVGFGLQGAPGSAAMG